MNLFNQDGSPGKILTDLVQLRKLVGHLAPEQRPGVMFKVKDAALLMQKLREAGDDLGMPMVGSVVEQIFNHFEPISGTTGNGKPCTTLIVHCKSTIRFMSSDGTYADFVGSGNGSGTDDKSGGKASTYSQKDAVLKALSVPNNAIPDTDDENVPLPAKSTRATTIPTLEVVLDAIKFSKTPSQLNEAKTLAQFKSDWSGADKDALQAAFIKKTAALKTKDVN